ncbi:MAG: hypothetical protein D6797_05740 [Bdellovibrio sp.]|nr:MAG: hypothetical protein D6797_05740 [Bdellovibrio sp.]
MVKDKNVILGPFATEELTEALKKGEVSQQAQVKEPGGYWLPVGSKKEFSHIATDSGQSQYSPERLEVLKQKAALKNKGYKKKDLPSPKTSLKPLLMIALVVLIGGGGLFLKIGFFGKFKNQEAIHKAHAFLRQKKLKKALEVYSAIKDKKDLKPQEVSLWLLLSLKVHQSPKVAKKILNTFPDSFLRKDARFSLLQGLVAFYEKKYKKAQEWFKQFQSSAPTLALLNQARMAYYRGAYHESKNILQDLRFSGGDKDVRVILDLTGALIKLFKTTQKDKYLNQAYRLLKGFLAASSYSPKAYLALSYVQALRGQPVSFRHLHKWVELSELVYWDDENLYLLPDFVNKKIFFNWGEYVVEQVQDIGEKNILAAQLKFLDHQWDEGEAHLEMALYKNAQDPLFLAVQNAFFLKTHQEDKLKEGLSKLKDSRLLIHQVTQAEYCEYLKKWKCAANFWRSFIQKGVKTSKAYEKASWNYWQVKDKENALLYYKLGKTSFEGEAFFLVPLK